MSNRESGGGSVYREERASIGVVVFCTSRKSASYDEDKDRRSAMVRRRQRQEIMRRLLMKYREGKATTYSYTVRSTSVDGGANNSNRVEEVENEEGRICLLVEIMDGAHMFVINGVYTFGMLVPIGCKYVCLVETIMSEMKLDKRVTRLKIEYVADLECHQYGLFWMPHYGNYAELLCEGAGFWGCRTSLIIQGRKRNGMFGGIHSGHKLFFQLFNFHPIVPATIEDSSGASTCGRVPSSGAGSTPKSTRLASKSSVTLGEKLLCSVYSKIFVHGLPLWALPFVGLINFEGYVNSHLI
ncbi:Hypothetical predicted protein [Olea europaea subsp. europaea]|uniref:Uncharacterized protein n=1 Tax=Olea europaea subsp. europaea TaxID=158383 RepID=A0A8S0SZF5_OLEEU|nr:Hypothetical predicted protein [Olea europaea subsp. europaea]